MTTTFNFMSGKYANVNYWHSKMFTTRLKCQKRSRNPLGVIWRGWNDAPRKDGKPPWHLGWHFNEVNEYYLVSLQAAGHSCITLSVMTAVVNDIKWYGKWQWYGIKAQIKNQIESYQSLKKTSKVNKHIQWYRPKSDTKSRPVLRHTADA